MNANARSDFSEDREPAPIEAFHEWLADATDALAEAILRLFR